MNKHLLAVALMSEGLLHIDMVRRTTSSIRIDDNLVLRPVGLDHAEELIEAFEETWPEVSRAMPWINPDSPIPSQIEDFLEESERLGRTGRMHHWTMIRPWDNGFLGLIGYDNVTRSSVAKWNLGYWVRSSAQRHGIARKSINAVLSWMGEAESMIIEVKVDPLNLAGQGTVLQTVRNWNGERCVSGDSAVTVAGVRTVHECHIIQIGPSKP